MNQRPRNGNQRPDPRMNDPRYIAAKRAYIARRRKEIRRNRIILGSAALVISALLVFLIVMIMRGIAGAIADDGATADTEKSSGTVTEQLPLGTPNQTADSGNTGDGTTPSGEPAATQTESVTEEPEPVYELNFKADLADYEAYMDPQKDARDAYLILVNPKHPLTENDIPDDLIDVSGTRRDGRAVQQMQRTAAKALEALFIEAMEEGIMTPDTPSGYPLSVTSAYRDYTYQNTLFSQYTRNELNAHPNWTKEQAEAQVETYSCRAGTSEHQTGLCCDMHTLSAADISFKNEKQAMWLSENAWKFGFILRFPEDKTDVTGISYEPWHFRFVGRYHAYKIWKNGLCLEEYVESLE